MPVYIEGKYNTPNPLVWFLVLFGALLVVLGPVFYSIKPDTMQLVMPLVMGLGLLVPGVLLFIRQGRISLTDAGIVLKPMVGKETVMPLQDVEYIRTETSDTGAVKMTLAHGGKTRTLTRVKPKTLPGLLWVALIWPNSFPKHWLSQVQKDIKTKELPTGVYLAGRTLQQSKGGKLDDSGIVIQSLEQHIYIPTTVAMRGPGLLALAVSPVVTYTTVRPKYAPSPDTLPIKRIVQFVLQNAELKDRQRFELLADMASFLLGHPLEEAPVPDARDKGLQTYPAVTVGGNSSTVQVFLDGKTIRF